MTGELLALVLAIPFAVLAAAMALAWRRGRMTRDVQMQVVESAPDATIGIDAEGRIVLANSQTERLFGYRRAEILGAPIAKLLPYEGAGDGPPPYVSELFSDPDARPVGVPLEVTGHHRLGHEFPCEVALSRLAGRRETTGLIAVRDVTARKRSEEELRRAFRRLEAATDIARAIGGETELEAVLDGIVERGRALVEARGLVVMLVEGESLMVAATAGNVDTEIRGMRVPLTGLTGAAVRTLQPQRVEGMSELTDVPGGDGGRPSAAIVVPLEFRGAALGVVAAFDRRDGPQFTGEDERLLIAFATSAATAVATARDVAQDRLRRTIEAAEQERKRWARELHDETLQGLGALRVALASALRGSSQEGLRQVVATAVDEIAEEIRSLRSLISELRPAALDELGLPAAIEALSDRSATLVGLEMETDVDLGGEEDGGAVRLDPELESTIYRFVQEALSNIAKHARAERVGLRVGARDGVIEVSVVDDGVGFDPEAAYAGFGLLGMRERIQMAGGEMRIESTPGQGTRVEAKLPAHSRPPVAIAAAPERELAPPGPP